MDPGSGGDVALPGTASESGSSEAVTPPRGDSAGAPAAALAFGAKKPAAGSGWAKLAGSTAAGPLRVGEPPPAARSKLRTMLRLKAAAQAAKPEELLPLPDGINQSTPGIAIAWQWFQRVDRNKSGVLELAEVGTLAKHLGLEWTAKQTKRSYVEMCENTPYGGKQGVSFEDFAVWWARYQAATRREMKRIIKDIFQRADADGSGILTKSEFQHVVENANKNKALPTIGAPKKEAAVEGAAGKYEESAQEFQLEEAWEELKKIPIPESQELGVNFASFEAWWKGRAGIVEADIPVLPEFMVLRIAEKVKANENWNQLLEETLPGGKASQRPRRSKNWTTLAEKLRAMVRMKTSWGELHDIYSTHAESAYEAAPLPPWTRDPESTFSMFWDVALVLMLLFVTWTVPLRVCFEIDIELWSPAFFVDLVVDLFFVADVFINCRTTYFDANGFRETRPKEIFKNYLRSWFAVDVFSCLPFGYVQYFMTDEVAASAAGQGDPYNNYKGIKAVRLLKISKLIRLTRLKRILMRRGSDMNLQQWMPATFTLIAIVFLCHLLTCGFFAVGTTDEVLANGERVAGWVEERGVWMLTEGNVTRTDPRISVSVRYVSSMYYVLNALEAGETTQERAFGVFAELMRDIILGLVAGLITTISMSMSSTDNATNLRLRHLRAWLAEKKLPKGFRMKVMEHFNETWTNSTNVDLPALLEACPPAMAASMAELMFSRVVSSVPLFKGLSPEVISALCLKCKPMHCMKNQNVISEGEPGREMYMLISGEVEVCEKRMGEDVRLGFLSEGAFFGEAPVLGINGELGLEVRTRTVRAVTDIECVYITRDDVQSLCEQYQELKARMRRFSTGGGRITNQKLRTLDLTQDELTDLSADFKKKTRHCSEVRKKHNLESDSFVPDHLLPEDAAATVKAAGRFMKGGAARHRKDREEREERAAQLKAQLEGDGLGSLLVETEATRQQVDALTSKLETLHTSVHAQMSQLAEQMRVLVAAGPGAESVPMRPLTPSDAGLRMP